MNLFIGTKIVSARPMSRGEYNTYRGWELPSNEDGNDAGHLVEYRDGGAPNDDRHAGYISWSPAEQFEKAYIDMGNVSGLQAHQQRVVGELAELVDRTVKLGGFIAGSSLYRDLPSAEQGRLTRQRQLMEELAQVLTDRIACF